MPAQTIFVRSLPASASNQRLEEIFSEIGPIKQCFVVKEKGTETCRGFGYVTYSIEEDAQRALKEVKDYDGQRLFLSVAKKKIRDKKKTGGPRRDLSRCPPVNFCFVFHVATEKPTTEPKENESKPKGFRKKQQKARLIIRNLSFKCSEDDLKEVFSKFGTVLEATIPLKDDGKMRGFAFVMLKKVPEAAKALKAMNLKEIKGRQVAVDWAVPRDKFIATQKSSIAGNFYEVQESQSEDEDDSVDQASEEEEEDEDDEDDDDQSLDEDDNESVLDSNEEQDESDDEPNTEIKTSKKLLPSDVKEGRTIFIRNLSFDTEEEGLEEVLLQYGELNYIKIVLHPDTEHSKGCAFAQFKTKEAADKCIAAAQDEAENGGIRVDGRKLFIMAAVSREDAAKLKVKKVKVETGTRNLFLAREGLIRAGTKAAEGVSEADMIKRTRFEEVKRAKLRDLNVFVSRNRLCVHNLPKSVDNKKLKALCLQANKGSKGVHITECRVMYNKKPQKGQMMGQSLGYGFIQFREHEHALSTLRHLNNNPDIFGSHKRPIVEFSLEDSRKLKIKEMRQQRNKRAAKTPSQAPVNGKGPTESGGKQSSKKDGHFSGFQTNPEVEHVNLENGKKRKKVLHMPSHRGPKIRYSFITLTRHNRLSFVFSFQNVKTAKRPLKSRGGDRFDSLVEQYKKKLMGNGERNTIKRNKWFDS
uniref:RNA-binding protein 28 n=1 Tax=Echeneis naucrates TaxID=173247 RepID=A0A665V1S4_ECHNA